MLWNHSLQGIILWIMQYCIVCIIVSFSHCFKGHIIDVLLCAFFKILHVLYFFNFKPQIWNLHIYVNELIMGIMVSHTRSCNIQTRDTMWPKSSLLWKSWPDIPYGAICRWGIPCDQRIPYCGNHGQTYHTVPYADEGYHVTKIVS